MKFIRTFLAALLAFVVGNVVVFMMTIMFFSGFAAMFASAPEVVSENSILRIDLLDPIVDNAEMSPFSSIDFSTFKIKKSSNTLAVISAIERAANDDKIKGIYINIQGGAPIAIIEEMRAEIEAFKESGKFVISYNDVYSQSGYYLSSVADKVYMNPEGGLDWRGLAMNVMFYKGLLDKLGVKAEVIRHGTFKSAVEPFINTSMSPANRLQTQTLANDLWSVILGDVAKSRGLDSARLSLYASNLDVVTAEDAVKCGLVDSLMYNDQVNALLSALVDGSEEADSMYLDETPDFVGLTKYVHSAVPAVINTSDNKVAIIYVDGTIIDGESVEDQVGGYTIAKKLEKVRNDDNVKALVLRVNSPGGSALASEIMWREVELVREKKPVVVSMSSVAASGGYYVSAPADVILADKFTITGSIGVFGLLFDAQQGLKDKLGITVDVAKTNPSADLGSPFRALSTQERVFLQKGVEKVYTTFVDHVASGRNLTTERVDSIGQGRVWSGVRALEIGLVDGFGGIKQAIQIAADRAGVTGDFRVYPVTNDDDKFTQLLSALGNVKNGMIRSEMGEAFAHYSKIQNLIKQQNSVQAVMPYTLEIR